MNSLHTIDWLFSERCTVVVYEAWKRISSLSDLFSDKNKQTNKSNIVGSLILMASHPIITDYRRISIKAACWRRWSPARVHVSTNHEAASKFWGKSVQESSVSKRRATTEEIQTWTLEPHGRAACGRRGVSKGVRRRPQVDRSEGGPFLKRPWGRFRSVPPAGCRRVRHGESGWNFRESMATPCRVPMDPTATRPPWIITQFRPENLREKKTEK
jgi:hypothetical protein